MPANDGELYTYTYTVFKHIFFFTAYNFLAYNVELLSGIITRLNIYQYLWYIAPQCPLSRERLRPFTCHGYDVADLFVAFRVHGNLVPALVLEFKR